MFQFYKGAIRLLDTNPIIFAAWVMGGLGVALPLVVVPIRQSLGFQVNQYTKVTVKKE